MDDRLPSMTGNLTVWKMRNQVLWVWIRGRACVSMMGGHMHEPMAIIYLSLPILILQQNSIRFRSSYHFMTPQTTTWNQSEASIWSTGILLSCCGVAPKLWRGGGVGIDQQQMLRKSRPPCLFVYPEPLMAGPGMSEVEIFSMIVGAGWQKTLERSEPGFVQELQSMACQSIRRFPGVYQTAVCVRLGLGAMDPGLSVST